MMVTSERPCYLCKVHHEVEVPREGYRDWANGMLIQRAMPALSSKDREILISGNCDKSWDAMFGGDKS